MNGFLGSSYTGPIRPPIKPNGGYNQPETGLALPSKPAARREDKVLASTAGSRPKNAGTHAPFHVVLNYGTPTGRRSDCYLAEDESEAIRLAQELRSDKPGAFVRILEIDYTGRPPRRPRWRCL